MDSQRAQEISFSADLISVTYNGKPVYIEHVDQDNGVATIHPLDEPNNKQTVAVGNLKEQ